MNESTKMVNTTTNPEVYFGRLNLLFDLFLTLKLYEKYNIFTGKTPSQDYDYLLANLERSVNAFIDRSVSKQTEKIATLKTEKSKLNSMEKYAEKMRNAFKNANTFWSGNNDYYHYTGKLYTPSNLDYLNNQLRKYGV